SGQAYARDLPKGRVGLLRRHREHARTDTPALGRALQRGRLRLRPLRLAAVTDQLLDRRHRFLSGDASTRLGATGTDIPRGGSFGFSRTRSDRAQIGTQGPTLPGQTRKCQRGWRARHSPAETHSVAAKPLSETTPDHVTI